MDELFNDNQPQQDQEYDVFGEQLNSQDDLDLDTGAETVPGEDDDAFMESLRQNLGEKPDSQPDNIQDFDMTPGKDKNLDADRDLGI